MPPTAASDSSSTPSTYNPHLGPPGPTFQSGLPLYQPGANVGPWGPSPPPPSPNTSGLAMPPMYWPGYYPPPNTLPQLHQQSLPRPPPMQYPSFNSSLSSGPPNTSASSAILTTNSLLGSTLPSLPAMMHNNNNKPQSSLTTDGNVISGSRFPFPGTNQSPISAGGGPPSLVPSEPPTPSLVTPGQLLQSVVPAGGVSVQSVQVSQNDVEVVQVSPPSVPIPVTTEAQPPILPLPTQTHVVQKPNGATYQNRSNYSYRGRERGRGSGGSRPTMKFTEEFDFNAMNEKFNKDEVWGSLGKNSRSGSKDKDGNTTDEDEIEEENDSNVTKVDVKPVYTKDDFFDSLSSNALDRQSNYGRTRFSEQMKLDTETFGEFSRYRGGGRGGRGPYRGGRSRGGGGYYGRGGGGYGYVGRGRGVTNPNPNPNPNTSSDY